MPFGIAMSVCFHVGSEGGGCAVLFQSELLQTEGFVRERERSLALLPGYRGGRAAPPEWQRGGSAEHTAR